MKFRLAAAASLYALGLPPAVLAADEAPAPDALSPVIVTATRIEMKDSDAPYASEVHRREEIERSGATTLVDYLARYSSLQVLPNYGNRYSPALNMRGYGITDGYQNVVVTVDGRRLNNVDMVPQLLGSVSLADVDRIEITKGSGSVLYGDGATAGTIQIHTRPRDGATVDLFGGSNGSRGASLSAGLVRERFSLSASAERNRDDGAGDKDATGHRDAARADIWRVGIDGKPVDELKLRLDAGESRIDTRYPNSLTLAQFKDDPAQIVGDYTHQKFNTHYWSVGGDYDFSSRWRLSADHHDESRYSKWVNWGSESESRYLSDDISLQFRGDKLAVTAGAQLFDAVRKGSDNDTDKRNRALFLQAQYSFDRLTLSAGVRGEQVRYRYRPDVGEHLEANERFLAWDVGFNYRVDEALSVFGNYNDAHQAPDIDRFFNWPFGGLATFNGFIDPAHARTLTLGLNHSTATNRLKLAVFHARLRNEIFYDQSLGMFGTNTNIDRSRKFGIEVQDSWQIVRAVAANVNYSWTRALIDRDDSGGGAFNGKELPGVPRHSLVAGLAVDVVDGGRLYLSHTWRSRAWAAGDFDNNNSQRQRAYQSTDLSYRQQITKQVELYGAVSNLFEHENGMWVGDDQIYPVDYSRTWKLGARVSF